jgi:hypothetical protein
MNSANMKEIWQIDIGGQIYETDFEVMTQWILEGSVLPNDKLRCGNLRWVEARKIPALVPFFYAKEKGLPPSVLSTRFSVRSSP